MEQLIRMRRISSIQLSKLLNKLKEVFYGEHDNQNKKISI